MIVSATGFSQSDTSYISSIPQKDFLQLYAGSFSRSIEFCSTIEESQPAEIRYSPNSSAFCGFVLGYKKITLYGDVALPLFTKVNRTQSDVSAFTFFLSYFKSKWGITGFAGYNRGLLMRIENMSASYNSRTDMKMYHAGAHLYRIFNASRFSFIAANSQQMLQLKSAGSFILKITPSFRLIKTPESIIPFEKSKYHLTGEMMTTKQIQLLSLQVKPGYTYNFILPNTHFFIAPSFFAGTGIDYHFLKQPDKQINGFNLNFGYRFKTTAGINSNKYFLTAEFLRDHSRSYLYRSEVKNTYAECTLNFGFRF
jgi:hypothetical protein